MPHNWFSLEPNPSPKHLRHADVGRICADHGAHLERFWVDDPDNPKKAYALVWHPGDVSALVDELQPKLHEGPLHEAH
jgi:hypothetical protein